MAGRKGGRHSMEQCKKEPQLSPADKKMGEPLDEQELEALYAWVDGIPISRPKKNIARDFSDGVLVAEIVKYFFPFMVEIHNYTPSNNSKTKEATWRLINRRVFNKLNFELADDVIKDLVCCKPGMIEKVLLMLQVKIESATYARGHMNDKPEADQHQASPGRRDGRPGKFGGDAKTKNFGKAKQLISSERLDLHAPVKRTNNDTEQYHDSDITSDIDARTPYEVIRFDDYGFFIDHRYLENRGWNSGEQESKASKQGYKPVQVGVPKKRMGPLVEPDMVPRYVVEEKEQEILSRDETVQILNAKIAKLEHLLHLKDMRISELESKANGYASDKRTNYNYRVYNKQ
ncbi:Sperm flagellar protein 1 [Mactra antiquata]